MRGTGSGGGSREREQLRSRGKSMPAHRAPGSLERRRDAHLSGFFKGISASTQDDRQPEPPRPAAEPSTYTRAPSHECTRFPLALRRNRLLLNVVRSTSGNL